MTARELILKTAAAIEQDPGRYDFLKVTIPRTPESCGCPIGWFGYFKGIPPQPHLGIARIALMTIHSTEQLFYERMDEMQAPDAHMLSEENWTNDAKICAAALRRYADRYEPEVMT